MTRREENVRRITAALRDHWTVYTSVGLLCACQPVLSYPMQVNDWADHVAERVADVVGQLDY